MTKKAFSHEWLPEPDVRNPGSFVPASSQNHPTGVIVLHEDFLDFPCTSATGMPGILSCPPEYESFKNLPLKSQQTSYDLAVADIPLSAHKIIRYIISPASDTTIIPTNLQSNDCSGNYFTCDSTDIQEAAYFLQLKKGRVSLLSGLRTNVKLDLVLWDSERFSREGGIYGGGARRFQIDGAVLLDPRRSGKFRLSESPVCLLGMDFLTKYPYLLLEPKYDTRGKIDFTLARGPLACRPYSACTEVNKKLVVHVSARHDADTGRIGCGVFFKSGSIFNFFSGVSKYGKGGNKHTEQLWERGVLVGVIKALHTVGAFPAGREFTDVIIRTGSPPTNFLLSQMQQTVEDLRRDSRNLYDDNSLDDKFSCPSPNSDLVMYICRQFIRRHPGIQVRFDGFSTNENYDAVEAAGVLASAGAEMEEFYMEEGDSMNTHQFMGYCVNQFRGHKHTKSDDVTLLHHHSGFVGHSIYVSLGLDGYFHIPKERAHAAMEAADAKAYFTLSREDAVCTLGYAPWEGEVAAEPNGSLDTKHYEYHAIPRGSNFKTLEGILGEDAVRKLKTCQKENPSRIPEMVLEVIQSSNREIKVHEFLSMQTKEYREEYLKELERRGLEKGWHFCKDKAWNGYLRRNTSIYNRKGWMYPQDGGKVWDGIFTLSNEKRSLSHWGDEKRVEKAGYAEDDQGKRRMGEMFQDTRLTETIKKVGNYNQTKANMEFHGNAQPKEGVRRAKSNIKHGSGSSSSLYSHYSKDDGASIVRFKDLTDAKQLTDSEDSSFTTFYNSAFGNTEPVGIGARVAARHHYDPQRPKVKYSFGDGNLDDNYQTDDSNDTDYKYNLRDNDDHSSEQWPDLEDSTTSDSSNDTTRAGKRYRGNLGSMGILPQRKSQFGNTTQARADIADGEGTVYSASFLGTEHEGRRGRKRRTANAVKPFVHRGPERWNSAIEKVGDKWPPFDWMLENLPEDNLAALL